MACPFLLLCSDLTQNSFEFLLENAEWLGAIDQLAFFLAIDRIFDQKAWRARDAGSLAIFKILLDTVPILAAVVTAIELIHVQTGLFGDEF